MKKRYPEGTILCVVKLLYSLSQVKNHWFATYLNYHKEKLETKMSPYDICLLITKDSGENFGITRLQTDNTLNVRIEAFIKKEETKIIEAKFKAKTQTILKTCVSRNFNGCFMIIEVESIKQRYIKRVLTELTLH